MDCECNPVCVQRGRVWLRLPSSSSGDVKRSLAEHTIACEWLELPSSILRFCSSPADGGPRMVIVKEYFCSIVTLIPEVEIQTFGERLKNKGWLYILVTWYPTFALCYIHHLIIILIYTYLLDREKQLSWLYIYIFVTVYISFYMLANLSICTFL